MRYRSKPAECEAMQWDAVTASENNALRIVAWVNANGGEAQYVEAYSSDRSNGSRQPQIKVRTINGAALAAPGHFVVMGSATFTVPAKTVVDHEYWNNGHGQHEHAPYCKCPERELAPAYELIDFYPCDPETFKERWEPIND